MAQSASKDSSKSTLAKQLLWEKAALELPLRWQYWGTQLKLVILARDGIVVDRLFADPTKLFVLSPEPAYADAVENPTAQSEQDIRIRKEQTKKA